MDPIPLTIGIVVYLLILVVPPVDLGEVVRGLVQSRS